MSQYPTDDAQRVEAILHLAEGATESNVGDFYVESLEILSQISDSAKQQEAGYYLSHIRSIARNAEIGWPLFESPPRPTSTLTDDDTVQLITMIATLHSFCYGAERLDEASFFTGPDSTPVRFYINSLYHYIAALYLLDKNVLPMGGTVFRVLQPLGLAHLLDPICALLAQPLGGGFTLGDTILKVRNKFLVHGTFSPADISTVMKQTRLHDINQKLRLTQLIWDLFNQSFVLKLKLLATLTDAKIDLDKLSKHILSQVPSE